MSRMGRPPLPYAARLRLRRWYTDGLAKWRREFVDFPDGCLSVAQEKEFETRVCAMALVYPDGDPRQQWIRDRMREWKERRER